MPYRSFDDYVALPYTIEVYPDNGDEATCFYARITELPGTLVQADNLPDLEVKIEAAKRAWIEDAIATGRPIPEPQPMTATATDAYPRREG